MGGCGTCGGCFGLSDEEKKAKKKAEGKDEE